MNYYYDNILKAVNYIEGNLTKERLPLSEIINCTGFSKFHFLRIFKAVSGYTINDYIRRRRMTEAAKLLTDTTMRIMDIAVLYGYNSQEAFTRAFKETFGVTPNYYRVNKLSHDNLKQLILSEELLTFKAEDKFIEPEIVEKDSFLLTGLEYKGENNNYEVPKLWNKFYKELDSLKVPFNADICYGLERYSEAGEKSYFTYLSAVEINKSDSVPSNFKTIKIQKSKYAVFPIKSIIENVPINISKIYSVYLPRTGLKIKGNYDFEYYDYRFKANEKESCFHFYVPIE
ncbi:AraC family transcriptional regulator [Clostridium sp. 19966]|uniref:AraC family transcriptional regulator n=1 Tax=Clostridium sp. 19966 TaxID=2768166 RepID=UPI0028DF2CE7|nr:AraC family transcriptional regulator [Clostridium sp. 19966]MDT8717528.1 AraC family transcriptional regulator [Clostridium sp. 19966]